MNSEAELASVVGHEIGHVTARHSAKQMSRQQAAQLGLGVASIISPTAAQAAGLASQGLGVLFLKYGRDDESQSDALGYRYMLATNYDPREAVSMFRMLARTSGGDVAGRPPEWLSTHPDPGNREAAAQERLKSLDRDPGTMRRGRDEFLRRLDGLPYGTNPRDGFFRGQTFYHPDLNLQLAFPGGWRTENRPDAVVAGEPNGAAVISIQLAQGTPDEALRRFTGQQALSGVREADYRAPLGITRSAAFSAQAEPARPRS